MDDVYFGIFFEINPGVVTFPDSSLMCLVPQVSLCHLRELSPSFLWRVNLAFVLLLVALDFEFDQNNPKYLHFKISSKNTSIYENVPVMSLNQWFRCQVHANIDVRQGVK